MTDWKTITDCWHACDRVPPEHILDLIEEEKIDDARVMVHAAKHAADCGVECSTILCKIKPMILRLIHHEAA